MVLLTPLLTIQNKLLAFFIFWVSFYPQWILYAFQNACLSSCCSFSLLFSSIPLGFDEKRANVVLARRVWPRVGAIFVQQPFERNVIWYIHTPCLKSIFQLINGLWKEQFRMPIFSDFECASDENWLKGVKIDPYFLLSTCIVLFFVCLNSYMMNDILQRWLLPWVFYRRSSWMESSTSSAGKSKTAFFILGTHTMAKSVKFTSLVTVTCPSPNQHVAIVTCEASYLALKHAIWF